MSDDKTDDLDVLMPDREVEVAGEKITIRELRFGMRVSHAKQLEGILTALFMEISRAADQEITIDMLDAIFSAHAEGFADLMAAATGKPRRWVDELSDAEGTKLMFEFWGVNSRFFIRQLVTKGVLRNLRGNAPSDGANSLPA